MAEEEKQKRQIAYKIRIKDILNGRYINEEGWTPNYVETANGKKVSRVNVMGIVVAKEEDNVTGYKSVLIDDSTGKIPARSFGEESGMMQRIQIGDIVIAIGRPREYGSERYLALEIIKKINDKRWIEVRRLELDSKIEEKKEAAGETSAVEESVVNGKESIYDKIIDFIKRKDNGEGVNFEDIIKEFNNEDAVKSLLSEGELFEIRPGRVKVLE
jgi:RPA family protein